MSAPIRTSSDAGAHRNSSVFTVGPLGERVGIGGALQLGPEFGQRWQRPANIRTNREQWRRFKTAAEDPQRPRLVQKIPYNSDKARRLLAFVRNLRHSSDNMTPTRGSNLALKQKILARARAQPGAVWTPADFLNL